MQYEYMDQYYDLHKECVECEEKDRMIDIARGYIDSIVQSLYSSQELDLPNIEDNITELCHSFGLVVPNSELRIKKAI